MTTHETSRRDFKFAWLALAHALLVVVTLFAMLQGCVSGITPGAWITLAWSWLVWPILVALRPGRSVIRSVIPLAISLAVLAPCVPKLLTLTETHITR
jgi:hypothetical protein